MNEKVSIIILNWNGWENTIRCLSTVLLADYPNYEIILIDNGSIDNSLIKITDWVEGKLNLKPRCFSGSITRPSSVLKVKVAQLEDSIDFIRARAHRSLLIVENPINSGFAGGCNLGIKLAFSDQKVKYIALLNNDIEIAPDALSKLVEHMDQNPTSGSCQPKIYLMGKNKLIDGVGINIFSFIAYQEGHRHQDKGQFSKAREILGVCAGAGLYRKEMLEQTGLFDEDFFSYLEDVDLSLRARREGWKATYVPDAIVYHLHSGSLGDYSPNKIFYLCRNQVFYIIKNFNIFMIMLYFLILPLIILKTYLRWKSPNHNSSLICLMICKGVWDGICKTPQQWNKRKPNKMSTL